MLNLAMDCDAAAFVASYQSFATSDALFATRGEATVRVPIQYLIETRDWEGACRSGTRTHTDTHTYASSPQRK